MAIWQYISQYHVMYHISQYESCTTFKHHQMGNPIWEEIIRNPKIYMKNVTTVLFVILKHWKQPQCPRIRTWLNK